MTNVSRPLLRLLTCTALIAGTLVACQPASNPTNEEQPGGQEEPQPGPTGPTATTGTPADTTVVGVAAGDARFTTLVAAVGLADLVATLQGPGPFTVFAPTNEAFARLGIDLTTLPVATLRTILQYHVVAGSQNAASVAASSSLTTAEGGALAVGSRDAGLFINGLTQLVQADVPASNGIVHAIDSVLLPPAVLATLTVTQVVSAYPALGSLRDAVVKADLATTLSTDPATFTVFAPENLGFSNLLTELGAQSLDDVSAAQLAPILRYHVLGTVTGAAAATAAAQANADVSSLGGTIAFALDANSIVLDARSTVLYPDIVTKNGVIHIVGDVLLPSLLDIVTTDGRFGSLVVSVLEADTEIPSPSFASTLDNDSAALTLFAPDDGGFAALSSALGISGPTGLPASVLKDVLAAHVVAGQKLSAAAVVGATGPIVSLSATDTLTANSRAGGVRLNGFSVISETDLIASNGYLHRLDSVVLPLSVRSTLQRSTLLSAYPNYSLLVEAAVMAGLVGAVNSAGTLLAPDNAAFAALLADLGIAGITGLTGSQLAPILAYHALPAVTETTNFANPLVSLGGSLTTATGPNDSVFLDVETSVFFANVVSGISGGTGLVSLVDGVLLPSIADVVRTDARFADLSAAFSQAEGGNSGSVFDVFDDNTDQLTLFAPSNAAFTNLLDALGAGPTGISGLDDFTPGQLLPILNYHAIGSRVDAAAAIAANGTKVTTLGGAVAISGSTGVEVDGASVITANIFTKNGIIHEVNAVLLPSITDVVTTDARFSELKALILAADGVLGTDPKVAAELDDDSGAFTLFAPSNASIGNFLGALMDPVPSGQDLTEVLRYHAANGVTYAATALGLASPLAVATAQGDNVTVAGGATVTVTGNAAGAAALTVTEANLFTSNGVIHIVQGTGLNGVLRP